MQIVGGSVESLLQDWKWAKEMSAGYHRYSRKANGAPHFAPFGSKEAARVMESQQQFLRALPSNSRATEKVFDSFKEAGTGGGTEEADEEQHREFQAKRQETIAQVHSPTRTSRDGFHLPTFTVGASRFDQRQVEKLDEHDRCVAQLVARGIPSAAASNALKIHKNNLQQALEHLKAKTEKQLTQPERPATAEGGRGARGRGMRGRGARGRGRHDSGEDGARPPPPPPSSATLDLAGLMGNLRLAT